MSNKQLPKVAINLKMAQDLIRNPRNWCKGDPNTEEKAGRSCAEQALAIVLYGPEENWSSAPWNRSSYRYGDVPEYDALAAVTLDIHGLDYPFEVNDQKGHDAVMAMFDLAIILAIKIDGVKKFCWQTGVPL